MTKLAAQIGSWAAWAETFVAYVYVVGYIALIAIFPIKPWTTIQAFSADLNTPYMAALTALQVMVFLQAILVLVLVTAIHDYTAPDKKILSRLGMAFAPSLSLLSSMNYYVQWAGVRQSILRGDLEGLGLFAQFNFDSPM
jgi:hypothetical protein